MMIYVKIHYGLGNQMFQYAFAKSLSLYLNKPFKLDLSFYSYEPDVDIAKRTYALNNFNINENIATVQEILRYTRPNFILRRIRQFEKYILPLVYRSFITEVDRTFDERLFGLKRTCYLHGYWQNELYFHEYAQIIRNDFSHKNQPDNHNQNLLDKIQCQDNAVGMHIRRGDYLTDKHAVTNLELCNIDYYHKAIDYLNERIENLHFFIFSDDTEWAKKNIKLANATYIDDYNNQTPHEDLRLMSACKHFIIANSSFSWWGAWLGVGKDKIVVGPKKWFKNGDNIMPDSWVKI